MGTFTICLVMNNLKQHNLLAVKVKASDTYGIIHCVVDLCH